MVASGKIIESYLLRTYDLQQTYRQLMFPDVKRRFADYFIVVRLDRKNFIVFQSPFAVVKKVPARLKASESRLEDHDQQEKDVRRQS